MLNKSLNNLSISKDYKDLKNLFLLIKANPLPFYQDKNYIIVLKSGKALFLV